MAPKIGSSSLTESVAVCGELKLTSGFKSYPPKRNEAAKSADDWMEGKIKADGAWPYWRVHDKLYDLTDFVDQHPGGKFWLETTRGSDITETFESSHFAPRVYEILKKYYVKDATSPRNSPFTFKDDGFFMTLKRKVTPIVLKHGLGPTYESYFIQDGLVIAFLTVLFLGGWYHSTYLVMLSGAILAMTTTVAHNFFHMKDNWRMYIFDFMLASSREWRISHVLSHHNFPNTIYDYEISMFEPYLHFLPRPDKSRIVRFTSFLVVSMFSMVVGFLDLLRRTISGKKFEWTYLIYVFQFVLLVASSQSLTLGIYYWIVLHISTSTYFLAIGLTVAHHHPDIYHEGDKLPEDKDWGMFQLFATWDRGFVMQSNFLSAITFGYHILHHIFPTIDLTKLPLLQDALVETCKEFGLDMQITTHWQLFKGMFRALLRARPNFTLPKPIKKTQ